MVRPRKGEERRQPVGPLGLKVNLATRLVEVFQAFSFSGWQEKLRELGTQCTSVDVGLIVGCAMLSAPGQRSRFRDLLSAHGENGVGPLP